MLSCLCRNLANSFGNVRAGGGGLAIEGGHVFCASLGNQTQNEQGDLYLHPVWLNISKPNFVWKCFDEFLNSLTEIPEKTFLLPVTSKK